MNNYFALHSQLLLILLISPGMMGESIVDRICGIDMPPETTISAISRQISGMNYRYSSSYYYYYAF